MVQGRGEGDEFRIPGSDCRPGEGPGYLRDSAYDLLSTLLDDPQWSEGPPRRWLPSDYNSFNTWQLFELAVPFAQAALDVAEGARVNGLMRAIHAALPYDEAERVWLCEAFYSEGNTPDPEMAALPAVRGREVELVWSGLRHVVYGRDLLRRWWAWRRQTDEFRGQGTLPMARDALGNLYETLASDELLEYRRRPGG
jgi:hypothetical protein